MPDEKTQEPHAEAVEAATHEPDKVGNPEHANPQPMMANAPRHKAEHEMPPSDEAAPEAKPEEQPVQAEDHPHEDHTEDHAEEHESDDEHPEEGEDEDQPEEPPPAVPGTPGNTGTILPPKPVDPAKPPNPDTITASKTAASNPAEGVPILDSNHTLSHIPPRDTKSTQL